jgi:hypothetical protein
VGVQVGVDRKVRSVDVEYKIPGEAKFQVTPRPIHKPVLVVPVEEQTLSKREVPGWARGPHRKCRTSPGEKRWEGK